MKHIVIIGNGIAGITTARHIRKQSDHAITVVSAESAHFFSRTALMYIYMGHMTYANTKPYADDFWVKNRITLKQAYVEAVDPDNKSLQLGDGTVLSYDMLVVAVGSKPNRFGWPGQALAGVQGLYSLQDLEAMERHTSGPPVRGTRRAVIVGGGLIGVEMAEMLHSRQIPVTFLVREVTFWNIALPPEEGSLIARHLLEHHIDLRLETELAEILPDEEGRVRAVLTKTGEQIDCQFVGLTVGVGPNIDFLRSSGLALGRGVQVNRFFETSLPDVYAIGDCAEFTEPIVDSGGFARRPVEQIWYTGRMHGETLAQTICGQRTAYQPGIFFNSAKFFDIEYQTYGSVTNPPAPDEATFYWEHPAGQHCLRINYRPATGQVVGINVFGMRLRHAVCDRWIRQQQTLTHVLTHLPEANFDPEFFRQYERDILRQYNEQTGGSLALKTRRGLFSRVFS